MIVDFTNEPLLNFKDEAVKRQMELALEKVQQELGKEYPIVINGKKIITDKKIVSYNPSNKKEIIGTISAAGRELVEDAIEAATNAFKVWSNTTPSERARYFFKAAELIRQKRYELNAWGILEIGKNWGEIDAEVAEVIDFCEFYAQQMLRIAEPQPLTRLEGEDNELEYIPLGVGVIIPPWNYPIAILGGMTIGAVVAGNTAIIKPSSDAPISGFKLFEILEEAGIPNGVLNFLPGSGGIIGDYLVEHPKTRFVAFTGSEKVGLRINELAAKIAKGQIWVKRVVLEMGGKDATIVDLKVDLIEAVEGTIRGAYGYQGQKCSACSRVVVLEEVYDEFVRLLKKMASDIKVDEAKNNPQMASIISESAYKDILNYIEIGHQEGKLLVGGKGNNEIGYYIEPTIFIDVDQNATIAQEEIFGPVLSVIKAKTFDEALSIANNSRYGLTGSVYSNDRANLEQSKKYFHVGNLYLNRPTTGAYVGVHPFGGFNMSGTDSKTGGRDYILNFLQPKLISERLKKRSNSLN